VTADAEAAAAELDAEAGARADGAARSEAAAAAELLAVADVGGELAAESRIGHLTDDE
jgi:hypothetical protein